MPGGRLRFGEDSEIALERDVNEEVGLKVEILKPLDVWYLVIWLKNNFNSWALIIYVFEKEEDVILSDEHEAYEWLSEDELRAKKWDDLEKYLLAFEAIKGVKGERN